MDRKTWFTTHGDTTHRHATRLSENPLNLKLTTVPRTEIRQNFYSIRVINEWNRLNDTTKNAGTIGQFKSQYSKFLDQTA